MESTGQAGFRPYETTSDVSEYPFVAGEVLRFATRAQPGGRFRPFTYVTRPVRRISSQIVTQLMTLLQRRVTAPQNATPYVPGSSPHNEVPPVRIPARYNESPNGAAGAKKTGGTKKLLRNPSPPKYSPMNTELNAHPSSNQRNDSR